MSQAQAADLADTIKLNATALGVTTEIVSKANGLWVVALTWRGHPMEMQSEDQWKLTFPLLLSREKQKRLVEQGEYHGTH